MIGSTGLGMLDADGSVGGAPGTPWPATDETTPGVAPLREMVDVACVAADRDPATRRSGRPAVLVEVAGSVPYPAGYPGSKTRRRSPLRGTPDDLGGRFRVATLGRACSHLSGLGQPLTRTASSGSAEVLRIDSMAARASRDHAGRRVHGRPRWAWAGVDCGWPGPALGRRSRLTGEVEPARAARPGQLGRPGARRYPVDVARGSLRQLVDARPVRHASPSPASLRDADMVGTRRRCDRASSRLAA